MVNLCWPASLLRRSCTGAQLTGYTEAAPIKAKLSRKQEISADSAGRARLTHVTYGLQETQARDSCSAAAA